ncbi:Protein GET1 [Pleurotus pulmonarius]|nr:GET complex subunit get1 [Pleurotus pulmonarius]
MSLLITIFALVFVTQLISWIGQTVLLELAYSLYLRLFHSSLHVRQRKLKTEILATKKELMQTSAQDQFAKWAKLRRSVDKGLADLEKLNAEVASNKSSFKMKFNGLIWSLTTGLQFIVGWWYRKSAVFYLPAGWFGPLEWWLSFPFAPAGSVSVGVWQMACRRVIKVGERVVKDLIASSSHGAEAKVEAERPSDEKTKQT